jgi:hypothetical protein
MKSTLETELWTMAISILAVDFMFTIWFGPLRVHLRGRQHVQTQVRTIFIIRMDCLIAGLLRLLQRAKLPVQHELGLQNTIHPFSDAILKNMILLSHADSHLMIYKNFGVPRATVLDASIRMMNAETPALGTAQSLPESSDTAIQFQASTYVKSDNFTRKQIRYQSKIAETFRQRQIGYIRHHDLSGLGNCNISDKVFIYPKTMKRVGGPSVPFAAPDKQLVFAQNAEETISTDSSIQTSQFLGKQKMQFPASNHRHDTTNFIHQLHNQILTDSFVFLALQLPIICLATNAMRSAKRANAVNHFMMIKQNVYAFVSYFFLNPGQLLLKPIPASVQEPISANVLALKLIQVAVYRSQAA